MSYYHYSIVGSKVYKLETSDYWPPHLTNKVTDTVVSTIVHTSDFVTHASKNRDLLEAHRDSMIMSMA